MKKKIICVIMVVLCAILAFSGCGLGSYVENGGDKNSSNGNTGGNKPDDPDNPDNPDNPDGQNRDYVVYVYLNNLPYNPGNDTVTVVWRNDFSVVRRELRSDGSANAGELDGDYSVYLEGVPSKYTYNPNDNTAVGTVELTETNDNPYAGRRVDINLRTVREPERGTGEGLYLAGGCYLVRYDGTYRAVLNGENSCKYYEYTPTAAGFYSVVSWVSVYDDEVNPLIDVYQGTTGWKNFSRTIDGGGASLTGGFTKNFRYEVRIDKSEVGSAFTFAVRAVSKQNQYPVYVDFAITYEGEYSSSNSDIRQQTAKQARYKAREPYINEHFEYADLGTKIFDSNNYRYNAVTGRYHYYSLELFPDGYTDGSLKYDAGYGPVLLCAITPSVPSFTVTTLYNANVVGPNRSNWLMLYNMWIEDEGKYAVLDFTTFIREDYYRVCNSRGYCYVTPELVQFLQKFAENHSFYTDGVGASDGGAYEDGGMPEQLGYYADQDGLWLFACGFYTSGI